MNKKSIVIFWSVVLVLVIVGIVASKNKAPDSNAYALISSIAKELNIKGKGAEIKSDSVGWNLGRYETIDGKMMRLYRPGYTLRVTNETTGTSTATSTEKSIAGQFAEKFSELGFAPDYNNAGDATLHSSVGFFKSPIGCVIRTEVILDSPEDLQEGVAYPIETTISCADDVTWENNGAQASTTPVSSSTPSI